MDELKARLASLEERVAALEAKRSTCMKKPTVEEIAAYCMERKNGIDEQEFYDHHERVGWLVGKNKTPMKCWQATIRTWEKSRVKDIPGNGSAKYREELISALKNSHNSYMPQLSNNAKKLFYEQKKHWRDLQQEVQAGIIAF